MAPAARCGLWLACAAAMAALAVAQTPPPPPPPRHNPSIMLPDEADGGGEYLSLLLSSQAHALASLAPPSTDPLASSLAGLAQVLLTLHDSVQADTNKPFHAPPLAALFAAGKHQVNTTAADAALSIADRVLDELAAADWTQPVLSKRVTHALGLEELFAADKAEWFAPAPAPPPVQPWPSKGQAVVDELNSSPAAAEKNAAADDHIQATQADYEQALTDARWRGKEMQSQRVIVDGISGVGPRLRQLEDGKLPRLQPLPNKTLKGNPLPPPKKQVVDVFKPGANATLVESERHLNLTKARFPIAPNNSDLIGPVIDILTADPVGSALAPALASPVGRDPKLFNPITSYTTTSTFGVGQSVRKLINNPQSLDPDILRVYRTVDIFNFASTLMVYRPCVIQLYENLASAWISGIKIAPDLFDISVFGAKITPTVIDIAPALIRIGADGAELNAATINIEPELINVQPNAARITAGKLDVKPWQVDRPGRPAKSRRFVESDEKKEKMRVVEGGDKKG